MSTRVGFAPIEQWPAGEGTTSASPKHPPGQFTAVAHRRGPVVRDSRRWHTQLLGHRDRRAERAIQRRFRRPPRMRAGHRQHSQVFGLRREQRTGRAVHSRGRRVLSTRAGYAPTARSRVGAPTPRTCAAMRRLFQMPDDPASPCWNWRALTDAPAGRVQRPHRLRVANLRVDRRRRHPVLGKLEPQDPSRSLLTHTPSAASQRATTSRSGSTLAASAPIGRGDSL